MACPKRFEKVKNLLDDKTFKDTLHRKASPQVQCSSDLCTASLMSQQGQRPPGAPRSKEEILLNAKDFIDQYFISVEKKSTPEHLQRMTEIEESIESNGTYDLTPSELTFGAKMAWRNAPRCIGRYQWSQLQVFDARSVSTARGMFDWICEHIQYGTNKGHIRSAITIFPKRQDGCPDVRIWNKQLIGYAGYMGSDGRVIGDPANAEFTELCTSLGWQPKYGKYDVLPLVLSAAGCDPEIFEIPSELVLEVPIEHPQYCSFSRLDLKWYALSSLSCMLLNCGGLEFPSCPFTRMHVGTEIGSRSLSDSNRFNMLEPIAVTLGLDVNAEQLWKDRALIEINYAVLHSFESHGVTIANHHDASQLFINHMETEYKSRGGCPSDWLWVVPPMSGSTLQVFHQEMLLYHLLPSFEYQERPWKTHVWTQKPNASDRPKRKFSLKKLARAILFSVKLMRIALAKSVSCTILFATETGKSKRYANALCEVFMGTFNAKTVNMNDYDVNLLEHESLVLVVSSTFGNGEPPDNGKNLSQSLFAMNEKNGKINCHSHSTTVRMSIFKENKVPLDHRNKISLGLVTGPLIKVRFSVFALGSHAYPNFAAFGHYMDKTMEELGAERIHDIGIGDDLCGQEQSFRTWSQSVFKAACETFCLLEDANTNEAKGVPNTSWAHKFRMTPVDNGKDPDTCEALSKLHRKSIMPCTLTERTQLQANDSDPPIILVQLKKQGGSELMYAPGDHLGIFPANSPEMIDAILVRLHAEKGPHPDQVMCTEISTPVGTNKMWKHWNLPICSTRFALTYLLDITTTPTQSVLKIFASEATNDFDRQRLELLATDTIAYEQWKLDLSPNIIEVFDQFMSLKVHPLLLLTQLPWLQQRFYSISSSPQKHPGEVHATVAVVKFRTQGGAGPIHEGLCSSWLNRITTGTVVPCFVRKEPTFHLPDKAYLPILMIGSGTGIAPFRSFWQQRMMDMQLKTTSSLSKHLGQMTLFFGCRTTVQEIYRSEIEDMKKAGVLSNYYVALSREKDLPKVYVQDLILHNADFVIEMILHKEGHFYVCGDMSMAHDVSRTLEVVLQQGGMKPAHAAKYITVLRDANRLHEDIFGFKVRKPGEARSHDQSLKALEYLKTTT